MIVIYCLSQSPVIIKHAVGVIKLQATWRLCWELSQLSNAYTEPEKSYLSESRAATGWVYLLVPVQVTTRQDNSR